MDGRVTDAFGKLFILTLAGAGLIYACFGGDNQKHANSRIFQEEKQYAKPRELIQLTKELTGDLWKDLTDTTYVSCNPANVSLEVRLDAFMRAPISDMADGNAHKTKQILEDKQYLSEHPLEAEIYWDKKQKEIVRRYGLK